MSRMFANSRYRGDFVSIPQTHRGMFLKLCEMMGQSGDLVMCRLIREAYNRYIILLAQEELKVDQKVLDTKTRNDTI